MINLDIFKDKSVLVKEIEQLKSQTKGTEAKSQLSKGQIPKQEAIQPEIKHFIASNSQLSKGVNQNESENLKRAEILHQATDTNNTTTDGESDAQAMAQHVKNVDGLLLSGHRTKTAKDLVPQPSYWEQGLMLNCYYIPEHDYYIGWHSEAGLRVISGRYAAKQNTRIEGSTYFIHTMGLQKTEYIPVHLAPKKDFVRGVKKTSANTGIQFAEWKIVEVTEAEFRDILKRKPDYKSLLRAFDSSESYLHTADKYAYKVVLDYKNAIRAW